MLSNNELITASLFVSFLWAVQPVLHKFLLNKLAPQTVMITSNIIYSICISLYAYYYRDVLTSDYNKLTSKEFHLIIFSSLVCSFLSTILYFNLMKKYKSNIVTALTYTSPIFTIVLAYYLLNEQINYQSIVGIICIFIGICIVSLNS